MIVNQLSFEPAARGENQEDLDTLLQNHKSTDCQLRRFTISFTTLGHELSTTLESTKCVSMLSSQAIMPLTAIHYTTKSTYYQSRSTQYALKWHATPNLNGTKHAFTKLPDDKVKPQ